MANQGTRWFEQTKEFISRSRSSSEDTPDLWTRCPDCGETLFKEALAEAHMLCSSCSHHFRMTARARLELLCDPESLVRHDAELSPVDALEFVDSKPYPARIERGRRKAGMNDAFLAASATIDDIPVEIGAFEFAFMGGSMGSVVGEAITRLFERATARRHPALVISSSGGARMQEGVLSLMQMARTCAALAKLHDEARMPYLSILCHPTTGGVAASFAMLGDVILAEPKALIGFAGPRVIRETIGQELPEGFQRSEYLLEHGMVDRIVPRTELRPTISTLLRQLTGAPAREPER